METEYVNVCDLGPNISQIKGLAANSTSPTDTWLVTFKSPVVVSDTVKASSGFMKININPESILKIDPKYDPWNLSNIHGLEYEAKVYRDITNQLVKHHVCPFFVLNLGVGENCSFDSLLSMLRGHVADVPNNRLESALIRNLYYAYRQLDNRPSISNISAKRAINEDVAAKITKDFTYDITLNEDMRKTMKLSDFLDKLIRGNGKFRFTSELWSLMLLICIACYSMHLSGMVHNDLHSGNIYIMESTRPETYLYTVDNNNYILKTRYVPFLYDFDRAYVKSMRDNPMLEKKATLDEGPCEWYSQCNKSEFSNQDIIKIFCYLFTDVPGMQTEFVDVLATTKTGKKLLKEIYTTDSTDYTSDGGQCFLQHKTKSGLFEAIPTAWFKKFNSAPEIIEEIYARFLLPENWAKTPLKSIAEKYVYCVKKDNFSSKGELNLNKQLECIGKATACVKK